jgi:uncharacterized protein YeaO (DUF488 family)
MADDPDHPIRTKRLTDPPDPADGRRHLLERTWPEGVTQESAKVDAVHERLAPSDSLREFLGRESEKFDEFSLKFRMELIGADEELDKLIDEAEHGPITLLHEAEDSAKSHAAVVAAVLRERLAARRRSAPRSGASEPGPSPRAP